METNYNSRKTPSRSYNRILHKQKKRNAIIKFSESTFGFLNIDGITDHSFAEAKNTLECKKTNNSNNCRNKTKTGR